MNTVEALILGLVAFFAGYAVSYLVMTIGIKQDKE
jgi:ABC-type antimicrobial peptide transport system permease subunit